MHALYLMAVQAQQAALVLLQSQCQPMLVEHQLWQG
jgi:hypothetical protein